MNFLSDNIVGASAPVLEALVRANGGALPAYGNDEITKRVEATFAQIFEREVAVFPGDHRDGCQRAFRSPLRFRRGAFASVTANRMSSTMNAARRNSSCMARRWSGCRASPASSPAPAVARYLDGLSKTVSQMPPKALSLSQVTECGTVYSLDEIEALSAVCRARGLALHMDGARFANALVSLGTTPAEMTWKRGRRHPLLRRHEERLPDGRGGGGLRQGACGRPELPAQAGRADHFEGQADRRPVRGLFCGDHWLHNATRANGLARRLCEGLGALPGVRFAWPVEANEVFPIIPKSLDKALRAAGAAYHAWTSGSLPEDEAVGPDEV